VSLEGAAVSRGSSGILEGCYYKDSEEVGKAGKR
jgi:hypothetical protein